MERTYTFEETIEKIRNLEIQGAESVAIMAARAFGLKLKETSDLESLKKYAVELKSTRPTEPALKNVLAFCLANYQDPEVIEKVLKHFIESKELITEFGVKKIENGMTVFTHCHSSTVTAILIRAKEQGKNFRVFNTETRPRFQGRITATELAEKGIPVDHFVDSAGLIAMKKCDLFLFGSDAITSEGRVINKIGTAMLLEIAHKYGIPSFACTNSWKFDPETLYGEEEEIEQREVSEVWEHAPSGINIHNPAFEPASADRITGVITELGIMKPETLLLSIQTTYPWLLKK